MNPEESKQKFDQANALYSAKRYAEAMAALDELEADNPLSQNVMYPRALCLAAMRQHEEALNLCNQLETLFGDTRVAGLKTRLENALDAGQAQDKNTDADAPRANRAASAAPPARIEAIDQLRGYAIFGMFAVNYFSKFDASPVQLHHYREIFTYADSIAPLFLFVVGMGMRLSILRRIEKVGLSEARKGIFGRYIILACVGFAIYQGWVWDALTSIALSGMLALLIIDKKPVIRIAWALLFLTLFQYIMSNTEYGQWMMGTDPWQEEFPLWVRMFPLHDQLFGCAISGGILGHWSWMTLLIVGSLGYDLFMTGDSKKIIVWGLTAAVACIAIGWLLRVEWPGVKMEWVFSKRYVTAPYVFLATGTSFIAFVVFYVLCDVMELRIPTMNVIGLNPLFLYVTQHLFFSSVKKFLPEDSANMPGIILGYAVFLAIFYGFARFLYDRDIVIKL
jgi:predicted acyltransferase